MIDVSFKSEFLGWGGSSLWGAAVFEVQILDQTNLWKN